MGKGLYRGERRKRVEVVLCEPTPEAIAYFMSLQGAPSRSQFTAGDPLDQGFIDGDARQAERLAYGRPR